MAQDPLLDFIMSKTRSWRGEPDPAGERPVDGWDDGIGRPPEGWRPPPPDVSAGPVAEPDEREEEERAARREPAGPIEALTVAAVARMFPHQGPPRKLDPDEIAAEPDEAGPQPTIEDFVQAVYDSEAELTEAGETVAERLHWAATTSPEEWAAQCAATGWPVGVRPGYSDLPSDIKLESLRSSFNAEMERVRSRGSGYIE